MTVQRVSNIMACMRVVRSRHTPNEQHSLGRSYPDTLKVFKMPASKFWYVGMYITGRGFVKKSTRCLHLNDAKDFAVNWYEERIVEKRTYRSIREFSFSAFAEKLQRTQKRQINRGELSERMLVEDKQKLEKDVLPYLGEMSITKIDYGIVDNFIDELRTERDLSQSTLKQYVVLIRKVLREAEREGTINYIPSLPTVKRIENPRPWFSPEEYKQLLSACRDLRDNPPSDLARIDRGITEHYKGFLTDFDFGEMYDFIVFTVHSFLRPSEWKYLKHKHIRTTQIDDIEQLIISVPNPKTLRASGGIDSTTTEIAADLYKNRILKRHDGKEDYLFFNYIKNRDRYVSDRISRMFRVVCQHGGLDTDAYGQKHTTYSLRHSALCYQILKTGGNDLYGLARNARTSVLMLEKFYLSHLSPQMPVFVKQLRTNQVLNEGVQS